MQQSWKVEIAQNIKDAIIASNPKAKLRNNHIEQIQCPQCGENEGFWYQDKPFVIHCNRGNKCGVHSKVKEIYPHLFENFAKLHPPTQQEQKATYDFQTWFTENFQNNPHAILSEFDSDVSALAESVGIDWSQTRHNIHFPSTLTGKHAYPIDNKHTGKIFVKASSNDKGIPTITFKNHAHGGMSAVFNGSEYLWELYQSNKDKPFEQWRKPKLTALPTLQKNTKYLDAKRRDEERKARKFADFHKTFQSLQPIQDHAYLTRKGISSETLRQAGVDARSGLDQFWKTYIAIPYQNESGEIRAYQTINEEKKNNKFFVAGSQKKGAFTILGNFDESKQIGFAEGLATAFSVYEQVGHAVICCIDAGNLPTIARTMKDQLDGKEPIIFADNDCHKPDKGNAGIRHALEAARILNCKVIAPTFPDGNTGTDFNDLPIDQRKEQLQSQQNIFDGNFSYFEYQCLLFHYEGHSGQKRAMQKAVQAGVQLVPLKFDMENIIQAIVAKIPKEAIIQEKYIRDYAEWLFKKKKSETLKFVKISNEVLARHEHVSVENISEVDLNTLENRIVIVRSPMGSGKTERIIATMYEQLNDKGKKPLLLSPIISLTYDLNKRIPVSFHYQDKPSLKWANNNVLCVNSLINPRLEHIVERSDALFLDEATAVLRQLYSGPVENRISVLDALKEQIKKSSTVICCDAQANDLFVEYMEQLRQNEKILIITQETNEFSAPLYFTDDPNEVTARAREHVIAGGTAIIATDTIKKSYELEKEYAEMGKRVLIINGETAKEESQRAFLEHPNIECIKYDVVIYSPAMPSGVSITKPHFTGHYGIFSGYSIEPKDCIQMLRRDRTAKDFMIGLPKYNNGHQESDKDKLSLDFIDTDDAIINKHGKFALSLMVQRNQGMNHFANNMLILAEAEGFTLYRMEHDENLSAMGKAITKEIRKVCKEERQLAICTSPEINEDEFKKLQKKTYLTKADHHTIHKFNIQNHLGLDEVKPDDVAFYDDGGIAKVKRFEAILLTEDETKKLDEKERSLLWVDRFFHTKLRVFFIQLLSILNILDGQGTAKKGQLEAAVKFIKDNRRMLGRDFKIVPKFSQYDFQTVNSVLNAIGLSLKPERYLDEKKRKKKRYLINVNSWQIMQLYLKQRQEKSLDYISGISYKKNTKCSPDEILYYVGENAIINKKHEQDDFDKNEPLEFDVNEQNFNDEIESEYKEIDEEMAEIIELEAGFCRNEVEQLAKEWIKNASNF